MLGYKMWLGITEPESGRIKEVTSLEFKNKIINVDILWDTGGYIQFIFDGISEGHSDGNSVLVSAYTSKGETIVLIEKTLLGVADSSKLGKYPRCK